MTNLSLLELRRREQLLDEWVAVRRQIARLEARSAELLGERLGSHRSEFSRSTFGESLEHRSMVAQYAAAGHVSQGSMAYAFADAEALGGAFPAVQASFASGLISAQHVREITRARTVLDRAVLDARVSDEVVYPLYEAAVLEVAENDTPARTRAHAKQVAATLAGADLALRHKLAAEDRTVMVHTLDEGLARLTVVLPEHLAVAIYDRLTRMTTQIVRNRRSTGLPEIAVPDAVLDDDQFKALDEKDVAELISAMPAWLADLEARRPIDDVLPPAFDEHVHAAIPDTIPQWLIDGAGRDDWADARSSDTRTFDQVRADLLTDLLLASDPSAAQGTGLGSIQAQVQVTISATTLAGLDEKTAELDGHGPLHPDIARDLAGRSTPWTRLFLDSTGMVTETDAYSPTESMKRHLRARDQRCRFPGCRVPAARCDIDHNHDHAKGGRTAICNLCHLCRGHHVLKHPDAPDDDRWTAHLQSDGTVAWTSPLGRVHSDPAPRRVMFA